MMNRRTSPLTWLVALTLVVSALAGPLPAAAQSAAEQAIQDTILRGNQAQVDAVATHDPSTTTDAAVGLYAQQLRRTNQGLIDAGVIVIELQNVEWGPISIRANSASATTFETWRTSFSDGPTEIARDRNVY